MTEKEIRLEIAKAGMASGLSTGTMEEVYNWVVGEKSSALDLDSLKVSELEQYLGVSSVRFRNRCMENGILTIGQLVRVGSTGFRTLRLVGAGLVNKLRKVLSERYGVDDW